MIHFNLKPEPEGFDENCRQKGHQWLQEYSQDAKRPKDLWTAFRFDLADAFDNLCAYTAMYEPSGTVDHFISWEASRNDSPELAYEWSNYRFASQWINSSKQNAQVLDPFDVQDDWFELSLPDLQLHLTDKVPAELRELAQYTLARLPIAHDERILRVRRQWYQEYETGQITLTYLDGKAPLIARAIRKQQTQIPQETP